MLFPITTITWQLTTITWQQLRVLVRAKGQPVRGRELRYSPTRHTKTGEFLDALVEAGLIAAGKVTLPADQEEKGWPVQFRTLYTLTDKGRYAAEHGEYERERSPARA